MQGELYKLGFQLIYLQQRVAAVSTGLGSTLERDCNESAILRFPSFAGSCDKSKGSHTHMTRTKRVYLRPQGCSRSVIGIYTGEVDVIRRSAAVATDQLSCNAALLSLLTSCHATRRTVDSTLVTARRLCAALLACTRKVYRHHLCGGACGACVSASAISLNALEDHTTRLRLGVGVEGAG